MTYKLIESKGFAPSMFEGSPLNSVLRMNYDGQWGDETGSKFENVKSNSSPNQPNLMYPPDPQNDKIKFLEMQIEMLKNSVPQQNKTYEKASSPTSWWVVAGLTFIPFALFLILFLVLILVFRR